MVTVEEGSTTKRLQSQDSTRYLWSTIVRRNKSYYNVNRKHIYVGSFDSPEEAYKARIEAIKKQNLENNADLKFIELDDYHK